MKSKTFFLFILIAAAQAGFWDDASNWVFSTAVDTGVAINDAIVSAQDRLENTARDMAQVAAFGTFMMYETAERETRMIVEETTKACAEYIGRPDVAVTDWIGSTIESVKEKKHLMSALPGIVCIAGGMTATSLSGPAAPATAVATIGTCVCRYKLIDFLENKVYGPFENFKVVAVSSNRQLCSFNSRHMYSIY